MPTTTTWFSLNKPLINDPTDQDQWGGYLNGDLDSIDGLLKVARDKVITTRSATYQILATDRNAVLPFDATAGNIVVTAPNPSTVGNGFTVTIKKMDSTVNTVTLAPFGSETFDGAASVILLKQYDAVTVDTDAINWVRIAFVPAVPGQSYVQGIPFSDAAVYTTSAVIPQDDTIPQNTEGFQVAQITITPSVSTNKLIIECRVPVSSTSGSVPVVLAVFQDMNINALYTEAYEVADNGTLGTAFLKFQVAAGTTSATTFYIRIGTGSGRALTLNGVSGTRLYGGVLAITAKVTEVVT